MTKPSWQDFATHDESIAPELWDGVIGAWAPCLGPTGSRLHDHSRRGNWGTLNGQVLATDWQLQSGSYSVLTSTANKFIQANTVPIEGTTDFTVALWVNLSATQTASDNLVPLFGQKAASASDAGWMMVYFYAGANAGKWMISTGSGSAFSEPLTSGTADTRGTLAHVVMRRSAGLAQNGDYIINGSRYALATTLTILNVTTTTNLFWGRDAGPLRQTNQNVFDAAIWRRCLHINEVAELYRLGPGGMYQRRRRSRIYIPQAGFQAAWARGSNVLLGFNQP